MNSPMSMTVITRRQIEVSGARTLSELLEIYVPGFQYMVNKWNGIVWGMRGVAPDRNTKIVFLVNGHKLNLESSHGNYAEISLGLLGDVERVEVIRGPAGLVLGSGSIAGAVNVVTRQPGETGGVVQVGYGTMRNPQIEALAHLEGQRQRLTLSFGAMRSQGLGLREGRVYGNNEWPTDGAVSPQGEPTDGSPWATPGNFRASLDWSMGDFRVYGRFTRAQMPTGQYFIVDPFPEYAGPVPADAPPRYVDGVLVDPTSPLAMTESGGTNRRLHVVDDLSVFGTWQHHFGPDTMRVELGFMGASDRLVVDRREGYAVPGATPAAGAVNWTFGERRYLARVSYLVGRWDDVQLAVGGQYRIDDIGNDLVGDSMFGFSERQRFVVPVLYHNLSAYTEGYWTPTDWFSVLAGVRIDAHTRTKVIPNPRAAVMFRPNEDHSVRLLVQSASNNGQADFYEYNWTHLDANGDLIQQPRLENPMDPNSAILRRASLDELRALRPERSFSAELNSVHRLFDGLVLTSAVSWTRVRDLFAWSTDEFREVNAGQYSFIAVEGTASYELRNILQVGVNHSYTRVVSADLGGQISIRDATQVVPNGDGTYSVDVVQGMTETTLVRAVYDQVTQDGRSFLNLSNHVTKLQLTYSPVPWFTFHSNARLFWGLPGRAGLWASDIAAGENYLGLEDARHVIAKWNASVHFRPVEALRISVYAYDLLGGARSRHAVRWQQTTASVQRELYTVDQRSALLSVEYQF
jgi:outer membrane receptor protein involved in Fe transport